MIRYHCALRKTLKILSTSSSPINATEVIKYLGVFKDNRAGKIISNWKLKNCVGLLESVC